MDRGDRSRGTEFQREVAVGYGIFVIRSAYQSSEAIGDAGVSFYFGGQADMVAATDYSVDDPAAVPSYCNNADYNYNYCWQCTGGCGARFSVPPYTRRLDVTKSALAAPSALPETVAARATTAVSGYSGSEPSDQDEAPANHAPPAGPT